MAKGTIVLDPESPNVGDFVTATLETDEAPAGFALTSPIGTTSTLVANSSSAQFYVERPGAYEVSFTDDKGKAVGSLSFEA